MDNGSAYFKGDSQDHMRENFVIQKILFKCKFSYQPNNKSYYLWSIL